VSFGPSGTHILFGQDPFMWDLHMLMWDICGTHILYSGVHLMGPMVLLRTSSNNLFKNIPRRRRRRRHATSSPLDDKQIC
jgi:hypothetical protein